jgi:hypothetical protein
MRKIRPQILRREGKNAFVVLTWEEFEAIEEALENAEDLRILREARAEQKDDPGISHEEMRRELDRVAVAYRRRKGSEAWHWCRNCSTWPTSDFEERESEPDPGELCNECRAKERSGHCRE